jgi:23S rRNA-/tRNA-specific pseudouridylate synthase
VGDNKYGDFETNKIIEQLYGFKNQFLHANDITFGCVESPLDNLKQQTFEADMPVELVNLLKKID